jgi:hypothetical protein
MATASASRLTKSEFIRQFLGKDPTANTKAVEEAWRGAGNEGSISSALVSNLRSDLGLPSIQRGAAGPSDSDGASKSSRSTARPSRPRNTKRKPKGRRSSQNGAKPATTAQEPKPRQRNRAGRLEELEVDIDRLIAKCMAMGGLEGIEGALREVRRLLFRAQGA